MGKKKNKKADPEKKAALQAKKEAKAEKSARKRLTKEASKAGSTINTPAFVVEKDEENDNNLPTRWESLGPKVFPAPRANGTVTLGSPDRSSSSKKKNTLAYMIGGEHYDGTRNIILNQVLQFDLHKEEWRQLLPAAEAAVPPPRCAHAAVSYRNALYVSGGELATTEQYHHYRDVWKLDLSSLIWTELSSRGGPSARSGHAAVTWKQYMVVFGGFYEQPQQQSAAAVWYNDVHVMDLRSETWIQLSDPPGRLTSRPAPRSACNTALLGNNWLIHGGFSKIERGKRLQQQDGIPVETVVHGDTWFLHLEPILEGRHPTWERWMPSSKSSPSDRSGTSSVAYKDEILLVFGGVVDTEKTNHKVDSVFYRDLFGLQVEKRKWFQIRTPRKRKDESMGATDLEDEPMDATTDQQDRGWDISKLKSTISSFLDGAGNRVYETQIENDVDDAESMSGEESEEEKEEEKCVEKAEHKSINETGVVKSEQSMTAVDCDMLEEPLPRINASLIVNNHTLYLFGGIVEVGDREVTMDDCWTFDLKKKGPWICLYTGTIHHQVWRGKEDDDDDVSSNNRSSCTGTMNAADDEEDDDTDGEMLLEKARMDESKQMHGLDNTRCTPTAKETLAEFYSRTASHWNAQATESRVAGDEEWTAKETKRQGFAFAQKRFDEFQEVMEKLRAQQL